MLGRSCGACALCAEQREVMLRMSVTSRGCAQKARLCMLQLAAPEPSM